MKIARSLLAVASVFTAAHASAVSLDDIQFWIGTGTNRAALVVEWSTPESAVGSTVPAPIADKSLVWGYRFNGTATGTQMLTAILAAAPRLYVVADMTYGTFVEGIGYNLSGGPAVGLSDGTKTDLFTNNFLTNATVNVDAAAPLNSTDLYWGGYWGPTWETWTELGDAGGFLNAPDRGANAYWTPDDPANPYSGIHGQWQLAQLGMDSLQLTNGSWIGFSVAAAEYEYDSSQPYNTHKHAPIAPDTSLTALIKNFSAGFHAGQWQAQFSSCTNWTYALERSSDLQNWTSVGANISGGSTNLVIPDPNPVVGQSFYRIYATPTPKN